ncbi:DUF992 domain-containing protein [Mesorhizobium sp. YM1C-6-2]|uniref:DUF992 domain-containing protein n=1 Tax=Mesorhizobium sp. YM1C-6-2 TaxID=1827501 RepID=UPI000EF28562|nr:DUF992 domain-containing protein [Mesorhizobium sp. YM1C-6-2]RLP26736.1 DUF992 domain-containing protein [Mesorhizobium sp. YM1C-6-2]
MIKRTASVFAASLMTALLAAPASAGTMRLGILTCDIEGGTALVIASHKGLDCTFKPSGGGHKERYTGIISKIGVDLGVTHQGSLVWAVLAVTSDYEGGQLAGNYLGATAEASVVAGGGANLLVGGFQRSFSLQPLSVQAQTGVNLALAVTSMRLYQPLK